MSTNTPIQELHSGDVLLMNRKCFGMKDPLSIGLCLGAKTVSPYDHTGVVYRVDPATATQYPKIQEAITKGGGPSPTGTYIVEANVGGVTLRSLEARLSRTTANEIAVRPIVIPPSERLTIEQRMHRVVEESLAFQYKSNLLDFVAMSLNHRISSTACRSLHVQIFCATKLNSSVKRWRLFKSRNPVQMKPRRSVPDGRATAVCCSA